jgi:hypothetical protein
MRPRCPRPSQTRSRERQKVNLFSILLSSQKEYKGFGEELSLDFGEWSEAAENCFRFHQMQDKDGDNGEYARWWSAHFKFFHAQEDKISQYEAWKDLDLKLRREYRTEPTKFDINHYAAKYEAAKTTFELKALIKEQTLNGVRDFPYRRDNSYRQSYRGGRFMGPSTTQFRDTRNPSAQSTLFPSGSRSSHLACCLLCSEKGHSVGKHYSDVMANRLGPKSLMANSALPTARRSALTTMSAGVTPIVPIPREYEHTSALSVVPDHIMLSLGSAVPVLPPINSSPLTIITEPLSYHDFSDSIVHRNLHHSSISDFLDPQIDIFTRITNLRNGFPLGDMPSLTKTVILQNHPSAMQYAKIVDQYLIDEVKAGRMSGPFSRQCTEHVLRGAFFSSPLLVSVQTQQPGTPDKLRVCRHLSKGDRENPSVNSHIHKEQFPTRFNTASRVADMVRPFLPYMFLLTRVLHLCLWHFTLRLWHLYFTFHLWRLCFILHLW